MWPVKAEEVESLIDLCMSANTLLLLEIVLLNCIIGFINKNDTEVTVMVLPFPFSPFYKYICVYW